MEFALSNIRAYRKLLDVVKPVSGERLVYTLLNTRANNLTLAVISTKELLRMAAVSLA